MQEYAWTPACCSSDVAVLHKHLHGNYSDELLERRSMSKYVEVSGQPGLTAAMHRNPDLPLPSLAQDILRPARPSSSWDTSK